MEFLEKNKILFSFDFIIFKENLNKNFFKLLKINKNYCNHKNKMFPNNLDNRENKTFVNISKKCSTEKANKYMNSKENISIISINKNSKITNRIILEIDEENFKKNSKSSKKIDSKNNLLKQLNNKYRFNIDKILNELSDSKDNQENLLKSNNNEKKYYINQSLPIKSFSNSKFYNKNEEYRSYDSIQEIFIKNDYSNLIDELLLSLNMERNLEEKRNQKKSKIKTSPNKKSLIDYNIFDQKENINIISNLNKNDKINFIDKISIFNDEKNNKNVNKNNSIKKNNLNTAEKISDKIHINNKNPLNKNDAISNFIFEKKFSKKKEIINNKRGIENHINDKTFNLKSLADKFSKEIKLEENLNKYNNLPQENNLGNVNNHQNPKFSNLVSNLPQPTNPYINTNTVLDNIYYRNYVINIFNNQIINNINFQQNLFKLPIQNFNFFDDTIKYKNSNNPYPDILDQNQSQRINKNNKDSNLSNLDNQNEDLQKSLKIKNKNLMNELNPYSNLYPKIDYIYKNPVSSINPSAFPNYCTKFLFPYSNNLNIKNCSEYKYHNTSDFQTFNKEINDEEFKKNRINKIISFDPKIKENNENINSSINFQDNSLKEIKLPIPIRHNDKKISNRKISSQKISNDCINKEINRQKINYHSNINSNNSSLNISNSNQTNEKNSFSKEKENKIKLEDIQHKNIISHYKFKTNESNQNPNDNFSSSINKSITLNNENENKKSFEQIKNFILIQSDGNLSKINQENTNNNIILNKKTDSFSYRTIHNSNNNNQNNSYNILYYENYSGIVKRNTPDEERKKYIINSENIINGLDKRTTLMIKNIPTHVTQVKFVEKLNKNFNGDFNFLYLPIDFIKKSNVGYAFINFRKPKTIVSFCNFYEGKLWGFDKDPRKICYISYARIQGYKNICDHFKKSSIMMQVDEQIKPIMLD